MILMRFLTMTFITIGILCQQAQAKRFASKYSEFELPIGWECALEGSEYVCQSTNPERKKEAIIILAAKTRGPQDGMAQYQSYLQTTKTYTLPGGKAQVSEPKYTKTKDINNHPWIDSLHLASEVPGFYTRYLATVKADLGVAVTFSVAKDHYDSYKDVFDKVIQTLRVYRQAQFDTSELALKKRDEDLIGDDSTYIPDTLDRLNIAQRQGGGAVGAMKQKSEMLFYLMIVLAIVGFIIYKKKKK